VQVDEKWSFVAKKEKQCDADDPRDGDFGDCWDHVALDAESRLVLSVLPGERTAATAEQLIREVHRRTGGRTDLLITSDAYPAYEPAIRSLYGTLPESTASASDAADREMPSDLCYATVRKQREGGRVVAVVHAVVFGTLILLEQMLSRSTVSTNPNTSFIERNNGTDRRRNGRKHRKTYGFSKDQSVHAAVTFFVTYSYNFCWPVRTLRVKDAEGRWKHRTPAMVAGLADHVWSLREWLSYPARTCQS
jgi:IS1 family transposase